MNKDLNSIVDILKAIENIMDLAGRRQP